MAQNVLTQRPQNGGVVSATPGFAEARLSILKKAIALHGHANQHDAREDFKRVLNSVLMELVLCAVMCLHTGAVIGVVCSDALHIVH